MSATRGFRPTLTVVALAILAVLAVLLLTEDSRPSSTVESLTGRVLAVVEEGARDQGDGTMAAYQVLVVRILSGSLEGQEVTVQEGALASTSEERFFRAGDQVYLTAWRAPRETISTSRIPSARPRWPG